MSFKMNLGFMTGKKILWEREEVLVTSSLSLFHNVSKKLLFSFFRKPFFHEVGSNTGLFGKVLKKIKEDQLCDMKVKN